MANTNHIQEIIVALRPPVFQDVVVGSSSRTATTTPIDASAAQQQQQQALHYDAWVQPYLSALLVGAHVLRLSVETRFTAAVLLHRYYCSWNSTRTTKATFLESSLAVDGVQQQLLEQNEGGGGVAGAGSTAAQGDDDWRYVTGCCLFLASKRHEEPRRLRDIVNFARMIDLETTTAAAAATSSLLHQQQPAAVAPPEAATTTIKTVLLWKSKPPDLGTDYWKAKERMVMVENRVLRFLQFDLAVSFAHRAVAMLMSAAVDEEKEPSNANEPGQKLMLLQRAAFRVLNDALYSVEALQHPVLALAWAAVDVAANEMGLPSLSNPPSDVPLESLEKAKACLQRIRNVQKEDE
jgi:hypothetical protein